MSQPPSIHLHGHLQDITNNTPNERAKSFSFYGMENLNCFWVWEYCSLNVPKSVPNGIATLFCMFSYTVCQLSLTMFP